MFVVAQLLCLIGEAFEDLGDEICGAVINLRSKGDKLGLWTADAGRAEHNMRIGFVPVVVVGYYCEFLYMSSPLHGQRS